MPGLDPKPIDYQAMQPDDAKLIREAVIRISTRNEARNRAKRDWLRDGLDILNIRRKAPHGTFQIIVGAELPYSVRHAQQLADAAAMLASAVKSEIISSFPDVAATVCIELAKSTTPPKVRDEYLPRVLAGERIKVADIKGASRPPAPVVEEAAEIPPPPPAVPSRRIADVVEHMPDEEGRAVLALIIEGETEALRRALEWRFSAPADPQNHRIREHARAAVRDTPQLDLLGPNAVLMTEANETTRAAAEQGGR